MAEITAKMVNELRAKTGQGMMECKKALTEVGGDVAAAVEYFRKKGVKASLAERAAGEGRIVGVVAEDGKSAALVEINTNTDFTAKSEPVAQLAATAARLLVHNPNEDIAHAANLNANITEVAQKTGENVRVGKTAHLAQPNGRVGMYLYSITGKIGVLVAVSGKVENVTDELVSDIGGHIAFARPLALSRTELPAEQVAREKEMAVEQAKATGKPQNIAEKIAEGKMGAFYAQYALLDQEFFNASKFKGTVGNMLKEKGLTLEKYVRLEVGAA